MNIGKKEVILYILIVLTLILGGCSQKTELYDNFAGGISENAEITNKTISCNAEECNYTSRVFTSGVPVIWQNVTFWKEGKADLYIKTCSDISCREQFIGPIKGGIELKKSKFFQYKLIMGKQSRIKTPAIKVKPSNIPPAIKTTEKIEMYEDEKVYINLSSLITDEDDPYYLLNITATPTKRLIEILIDKENMALYLEPKANESGTEKIVLTVTDSNENTGSTMMNIDVKPANDAPWADTKPEDGEFNHTTNYIDFSFTPHDVENDNVNCSINLKIFNETIKNARLEEETTVNLYLENGEYSWNVFCVDNKGSFSESKTKKLSVKLNTPPKIEIITPENNTATYENVLVFGFKMRDKNPKNCTILIDGTSRYEFKDVESNKTYTTPLSFDKDTHYWNVQCTDKLNALTESQTYRFAQDRNPPEISLIFPPDMHRSTINVVTFRFQAEEEDLDSCEIYGSWSDWQPNGTTQTSTFNPMILQNGTHKWNVWCNDTVGNSAFAQENFTLLIGRSGEPESEETKNITDLLTRKNEKLKKIKITRDNLEQCWIAFGNLTGTDIETISYLLNMVPCGSAKNETVKIEKKAWCNGIMINLDNTLNLNVGFLEGKAKYNINLKTSNSPDYCPWCYDEIKDYDEEEIDCGGPSCPSCNKASMPKPFKCGDGICEQGESCVCKEDCKEKKSSNITIILTGIFLIYFAWYIIRMEQRNQMHIVGLLVVGAAIATQMISACACETQCDNTKKGILGIGIIIMLVITIFKFERLYLNALYLYDRIYGKYIIKNEDGAKIMEIRRLIRKSIEALDYDENVAHVIYLCIDPLYKSLKPESRKEVAKSIKDLHTKIIRVSKKEYLTPNADSE